MILLTLLSSPTAWAATFTVTNLNDSGVGSLRQAILNANANPGTDTIAFQAGLTGTITLTTGQIQITDALTLNGPGANGLAVSGNNASRIFQLTNAMNGKVLTINQLTLKSAYVGGGSDRGGAIYGAGSLLTVNNCTLSDNNANEGGAIYMNGGALTINNSALIANIGRYIGGGIRGYNAVIRVNNSTLAYNVASGSPGGGGIYTQGAPVVVNNSTIFGNSGPNGGGIRIYIFSQNQTLSVNNSTVSGNSAVTGGGIYFQGNNSYNTGAIANSIVAGNTADNGKEIYRQASSNGSGLLTSLGHNLFGENGADGLVNVTKAASDLVLAGAIDTAISGLAYHGGPTQTQLLIPGSPAINAGDNALIPIDPSTGQPYATDQRGTGFPRIVGGTVDIGAVEGTVNGAAAAAAQTIGLYAPTTSGFYLRTSNSGGVANLSYAFGPANAGWTPITGDWDGDGVATAGLYNPTTSTFYLKNSHGGGAADLRFNFGPKGGWTPITGDWDGNGVTTIGLYNPATGGFYLKNSHTGGAADLSVRFGPANAGWKPLVGDWNGDGVDTIGLYNPATSSFYLKNSHAGGAADLSARFGPANAGWLPLVGDWDGNGATTIGLYNPATSSFYLKNSTSGGAADLSFRFGPANAGWKPLVGDWNGPAL